MGNCSTESRFGDDNHQVREVSDHSFGRLRVVRDDRENRELAIKELTFKNQKDLKSYTDYLAIAKDYDNIPTLIKLNDYDVFTEANCTKVAITFELHPVTLSQLLAKRKRFLSQFNKKQHSHTTLPIGLYEYDKIDSLSLNQRKFLDLHHLEAQILRMLDHVIGALYFLNHFENEHSAIRPSNVLIDQEGKYILADPKLLELQSNFTIAKKTQHSGLKKCCYLSPRQFSSLKKPHAEHSAELSDLFAVGLMALEMATMQDLDCLYDYNLMKINQSELQRLLKQAEGCYSADFMSLLRKMLEFDEASRTDLNTIIDQLSPVLTWNLQNLNRANCGTSRMPTESCEDFSNRLLQMQLTYQHLVLTKPNDLADVASEKELIQMEKQLLSSFSPDLPQNSVYDMYMKEYEIIKRDRVVQKSC